MFAAAIDAPIKETPGKDGVPAIRCAASEPTQDLCQGLLSSINLATGKIAWQTKTAQPLVRGVLAKAGELVSMGESD